MGQRTSPLFDEKERVALEFAIAAAAQPNDVTDEMFEKMKRHWSESQIVEIAAVVAMFGFTGGTTPWRRLSRRSRSKWARSTWPGPLERRQAPLLIPTEA